MCNLYTMTATVDELRRMFGAFDGDTVNLPPFDEIYLGKAAPVLALGWLEHDRDTACALAIPFPDADMVRLQQ